MNFLKYFQQQTQASCLKMKTTASFWALTPVQRTPVLSFVPVLLRPPPYKYDKRD